MFLKVTASPPPPRMPPPPLQKKEFEMSPVNHFYLN